MISSTALDLPEHREQVLNACLAEGVFPIGMEHLPARDASGIQASLEMVDQADIYIGVYAWRYGWVPDFDNPNKISITEMEFNRALERKQRGELKEILIFVMHDNHPILARDKEDGEEAQRKLEEFKQRASAARVMLKFESSEKLRGQVIQALADLKRRLEPVSTAAIVVEASRKENAIPKPPAFYAEPDYIGSHTFVGRDSQLQELSDWAKPADPTNLLLFEAIGGNGKSMLTWEWTTKHSTSVRSDWAGRFWYSFYERGAIMADFCQRALAYMTGQPLEELKKKKTAELKEPLLAELHAKPWLLILDGLERVLVAYHRIDAAEVPDEEANAPTDKIVNRNPTDAIRDEDNDLLRALAAAAPSKILVSSRLTPRVLLNPSGQPITGAKRITLPGLRPPDAEKLLISCGINGGSAAIQSYLTANCDNHPLVIGVLAGLIQNYLPDRGNFDAWSVDSSGGDQLDLARLDLIQRRNHILRAALAALPKESAELLSTLALLSESVDYETLKTFNPYLPLEPEAVQKLELPEEGWHWPSMSDKDKAEVSKRYEFSLAHSEEHAEAVKARLASVAYREAPNKLAETVRDLERRGLLQYDARTKRHDLHPVVRGVVAGGMKAEEKAAYGQRVVDYFSSLPHSPYEEAETLEDLRSGLHIIRTLLKLGHFRRAADNFSGDLLIALLFNLEAHAETLSLMRPFFSAGWGELPKGVDEARGSSLANNAAIALFYCGELKDSLAAYGIALRSGLDADDPYSWPIRLRNISLNLADQNLLAKALRMDAFVLAIATLLEKEQSIFLSRLDLFADQLRIGQWAEAEATWRVLNPMGRDWSRFLYRPGRAECLYARFQFWKGTLREEHLTLAESLAAQGKNRGVIRELHLLRGSWQLDRGAWMVAMASLQEAVRMARERGISDPAPETGLALAKFYLGQLTEPRREAEQLAQAREPSHRLLATLWLAIGDHEQARLHALAAYKWAWADGEPYVNRYELTKTTELLRELDVPIPNLPPYDPAKDEKLPWEDAVAAAIEKLKAEKVKEPRRIESKRQWPN